MNVIALFISFTLVLLIGCSEDKAAEVPVTSSTLLIDFNPDEFPEEPPEVEPEGGYSSLAALIESRNATPARVREALELGADVMELGNRGWTPLHWAASNSRDPEVVSVVLEAGADVNSWATEFTPLQCAALVNPNPNVIKVLLDAGADINAQLELGVTPLYLACSPTQKNPAIILLLLSEGADANAKIFIDQTALDFARKNPDLQGTDAFKALEAATMWSNR